MLSMTRTVAKRHHDVKQPVPPARTPAGDAFTALVLDVVRLGQLFTAAGEALARPAGQTLARWVILDAIEDGPASVAQIARRRGIARQAVQRVADLLEQDGLAAYEPNPDHRRAKLLRPTPRGRAALRGISVAQKAWADSLGEEIGEGTLKEASAIIRSIERVLVSGGVPGE
jgi:DNA-binding MarR family transcriptional regulator